MQAKMIALFCTSALMIQSAYSQCLGRGLGPLGPGWGYDGLTSFDALGYGVPWGSISPMGALAPASGLTASCGGGLVVTSTSPIAPTGMSVTSENAIEGTLTVMGQLPFLGAVATDGTFATAGIGAVSYGCGDGAIGIVAEAPITPAPAAIAPAMGPGFGYGPPLATGYGYNGLAPRMGLGGCGATY